MTPNEKIVFVEELSKTVTNKILTDINKNRIPDNWDGIELRQLLADRFAACVISHTLTGGRKRAYKNDCLVNNL